MILCVRTYQDDEVPDMSWTRGCLVTWTSSPTNGEHVAVLVSLFKVFYLNNHKTVNKASKIVDRSQNDGEMYLKTAYCRF